MKTFALSLALLLSSATAFADVNYTNTIDLPTASTQIRVTDADYWLVPTRTEERRIPGCREGGEASEDCTDTIVLDSEAVVRAHVEYVDGIFQDDTGSKRYVALYFPLTAFPAADVAALKAEYPGWKHPFSNLRREFAAKHLSLSVRTADRTIQVVDTRRSKLCPTGEDGEPQRGCVEHLVYKTVGTRVKEVTVTPK